jgi:hypothetical protein
MSWGTCYSGSNNIHDDMPPLMNDGRNYSSLQPDAVINDNIKKEANIKTNWEYRQYLQNNATQIMKYNTMESIYATGVNPVIEKPEQSTKNSPFVFTSTHDTNKPTYGYNNTDLKNFYLSREQLNSRLISPNIPTTNF